MPPWGEAVREAHKAIQASMQAGQQGQQLAGAEELAVVLMVQQLLHLADFQHHQHHLQSVLLNNCYRQQC